MSKLAKLRGSPRSFFADSRSPAVRSLGEALVPWVFERELVMTLLEDPFDAMSRSRVPGFGALVRAREHVRRRTRRQLIKRAGNPSVSVVMAAHNASATIESALESILRQSHTALEVVVVDDASEDDTAERVQAVSARDARVRLIRHSSQAGAAMARNRGLAAARHDYASYHDADDRSHPEKIERQLARLLAEPDKVACICNYRRELPDGTPLVVNGRWFAKSAISMLFRRPEVVERMGYMLDLRIGEDTEYFERLRTVFGKTSVAHLFETLYFARFAETSLLFSNGYTRRDGGNRVSFERSVAGERIMAQIDERMRLIRSGYLDPHVGYDAAGS